MRVLIAIDSFKGCMRSLEAGRAAEAGILRADPEAQTVVQALARMTEQGLYPEPLWQK